MATSTRAHLYAVGILSLVGLIPVIFFMRAIARALEGMEAERNTIVQGFTVFLIGALGFEMLSSLFWGSIGRHLIVAEESLEMLGAAILLLGLLQTEKKLMIQRFALRGPNLKRSQENV